MLFADRAGNVIGVQDDEWVEKIKQRIKDIINQKGTCI